MRCKHHSGPGTPLSRRGATRFGPTVVLALVAALTAGVGPTFGQEPARGPESGSGGSPGPLVTDRPDRTESAETVTAGFVQAELGWSLASASDGVAEVRTHSVPEALLRVGLLPSLEVRLGLPAWTVEERESPGGEVREEGWADAEAGLKLRLARGAGLRPAIALLASVALPTGEATFGGDGVDPAARLAVSHELGGGLGLGYNVGVRRTTVDREAAPEAPPPAARTGVRTDAIYTLALGLGLGDRLGLFLEGFGTVGLDSGAPDEHGVDGGVTLLLAENLQLDASVAVGLDSDAPDWGVGAGVSLRLPR